MSRYHVNGAGNPGVCHATIACPFGGDENHFDSQTEARKNFENSFGASQFSAPIRRSSPDAFENYTEQNLADETIDDSQAIPNSSSLSDGFQEPEGTTQGEIEESIKNKNPQKEIEDLLNHLEMKTLSDEFVERILGDKSSDPRTTSQLLSAIAKNRTTTADTFSKLIKLKNLDVTMAVLKNESTPVGILKKYLRGADKFPDLGTAIGSNPGTPQNLLEKRYRDSNNSAEKDAILRNRNVPLEILKNAARSENLETRLSAVQNKNTPPGIQSIFAEDPNDDVRILFAKNPGTRGNNLYNLTYDSSKYVKLAMLDNPSLRVDEEPMRRLLNNSDPEVSLAAKDNYDAILKRSPVYRVYDPATARREPK